ncbi:hypothetical protein [uncultured Planktosalinus sp.]|uniref:hypothetical protein n=1 Tax=uncultured Planktosalinus sp. TaxID=1810935 RepID=UPI0030DD0873
MKLLIRLFFLVAVGLVVSGFYYKTEDLELGHLLIGLGVAGGFFVVMPMFLYYRWKGKDVKDYMLTKDSLKKMREYETHKDTVSQDHSTNET